MPGVPSSRGCEGCRKQKIKCHSTGSQPPCFRCRRLNIICVGFGLQRFKFLAQEERQRRSIQHSGVGSGKSISRNIIGEPSFPLENDLTRLTSAFISNIDPSADIKIQLPWNFGDFLSDIPCRLGTNEALDAATESLVATYTNFVAGNVVATPDLLAKHSKALNALRRVLNDPFQAQSSETLCSSMLLMIIQSLPGFNGTMRGHIVGAAQILKGRGYTGPMNDFENKLMLTIRGPVIIEGLLNSQITMTQKQWKDLVYNKMDSKTTDGHMMMCLAQLPDIMHRCRSALRSPEPQQPRLSRLQEEVRFLSDSFRPTMKRLRERWRDTDSNVAIQYPQYIPMASIIHAHYSRSYGMALAVGLTLNIISVALQGETSEATVTSSQLVDEVLNLALVVDQHRPLGTMYMNICVGAAWAATSDPTQKDMLEVCLRDYHKDLHGPSSTITSEELKFLRARFTPS